MSTDIIVGRVEIKIIVGIRLYSGDSDYYWLTTMTSDHIATVALDTTVGFIPLLHLWFLSRKSDSWVHCLFERQFSTIQAAGVITRDVLRRTHLQFRCTPQSKPFQSYSVLCCPCDGLTPVQGVITDRVIVKNWFGIGTGCLLCVIAEAETSFYLKERDNVWDLGVGGRVTLNGSWKKYGVKMWAEFKWLKIESSGWLL